MGFKEPVVDGKNRHLWSAIRNLEIPLCVVRQNFKCNRSYNYNHNESHIQAYRERIQFGTLRVVFSVFTINENAYMLLNLIAKPQVQSKTC